MYNGRVIFAWMKFNISRLLSWLYFSSFIWQWKIWFVLIRKCKGWVRKTVVQVIVLSCISCYFPHLLYILHSITEHNISIVYYLQLACSIVPRTYSRTGNYSNVRFSPDTFLALILSLLHGYYWNFIMVLESGYQYL